MNSQMIQLCHHIEERDVLLWLDRNCYSMFQCFIRIILYYYIWMVKHAYSINESIIPQCHFLWYRVYWTIILNITAVYFLMWLPIKHNIINGLIWFLFIEIDIIIILLFDDIICIKFWVSRFANNFWVSF